MQSTLPSLCLINQSLVREVVPSLSLHHSGHRSTTTPCIRTLVCNLNHLKFSNNHPAASHGSTIQSISNSSNRCGDDTVTSGCTMNSDRIHSDDNRAVSINAARKGRYASSQMRILNLSRRLCCLAVFSTT
mmetsp:Transcript_482/g.1356  ORF Transcript_482/g.1356 Transcript_482/m.1356 type:complete len:131 (-) Transcript_482:150-542(-)